MKSILCLFVTVCIVLATQDGTAQSHPVKFNLFSGASGISIGKITCITRDVHGVMWFSDQSNQCLLSYDGTSMTRYKHDAKNINSMGGTYPECLYADSSGAIWIGFYGMGLDKFDPESNQFTHYRRQRNDPGSLSSDTISALLIDHVGNVWAGTNGGLNLLDRKTGKFKHFSNRLHDSTSLSCNIVRALYEDHEGTIWVGSGFPFDGSTDGGLNRLNQNKETFTRYLNDPKDSHSLANNKVRAIFEDSRGTFWIGTGGDGLHTMDRKTGSFERHTYNPAHPEQLSRPPVNGGFDHITFIAEDVEKCLWIGTFSNGLNRYDPVTKTITHYGNNADKSGEFKDNSSWWANASNDGLLWISTQESYLYRIDLFSNIIPYYSVNGVGVNSFLEESPSIFWIGTDSGLLRKDVKSGTSQLYVNDLRNSNSLSNNTIQKIFKDKAGNLWFGTSGGLNRLNPATGMFTRFQHDPGNKETLSGNFIASLYEDRESNFWISTFDKGLNLMDRRTGKFTRYQHSADDTSSLTSDNVSCIFEDQPNMLWIGTWNGGGINIMNSKTGKIKHYLSDQNIVAFFKDADGIIWIGSESGLFRYNRQSNDFTTIDEENVGFNINNVRSIIGDNKNNLWVGTFSGIFKINPRRDKAIFYGKESGIRTQNLYYNSVYKGQDGTLFFGGYSGYYAFYPDKLKISPSIPKMDFTNFWLNGQLIKADKNGPLQEPLFMAKEIYLKYDQNVFSFSFSATDYGKLEDKQIFYKLENYDREWRKPGSENRAYYFNMPPGKYIFKIKAANSSNGIWSAKEISVIITAPWWSRWWAYCLYGLLFIALAYSIHRFQKERLIKAERERAKVKELAQAKEIEKAYHELKTTQSQLIQSEKMASLGELTAGIAHEIQNPLNFVNNFSEVNKELLMEMKEEIDKGNIDEVKLIANNIIENEEKINHHGKRADAIVKGMLQHSRSSNSAKEPTDINALADEYLRLSYHGLRAKDKSFNATMKTNFDNTIGKINVIPQNIGRVILNLINNAFYAVNEKTLSAVATPTAVKFEPTVSISTKKLNGKVEISVADNGNGIPQKIVDKIFQPFFTTKPTGQGTGLGLSLSYDIVKAHGGEFKVETKEGQGSEFIIVLPV